jgi:hypothetical protein
MSLKSRSLQKLGEWRLTLPASRSGLDAVVAAAGQAASNMSPVLVVRDRLRSLLRASRAAQGSPRITSSPTPMTGLGALVRVLVVAARGLPAAAQRS